LWNPTLVGVLLGLVAFGLAVGWWRSRRVGYAIAGVVALAILGIVWFLHVYVDTDAKQIDRIIGAGVEAHNGGDTCLDRIYLYSGALRCACSGLPRGPFTSPGSSRTGRRPIVATEL
jgi:hypothetical protein